MSAILVAAGTATGALVGLASAVLVSPFGRFSGGAVVAVVGVGVLLDGLRLAGGGPSPPTAGRQVPREWGRLFDPQVVALLYGARLGVGPLTILSTWTWWSVTIAAALMGPVAGTVVGAAFGFLRLTITVGVSGLSALAPDELQAEHHSMLFRRLRTGRRSNWIAINTAGAMAVIAVALTGCAGGSDATTADRPDHSRPTIVTVPLENVVRTSSTTPIDGRITEVPALQAPALDSAAADAAAAAARAAAPPPGKEPADLAADLLSGITGFEPVEDPAADRHLDLLAAAELQPDPDEEVALLETRGFQGGWTRAFRSRSNDVAVASVYHFEDATEAEFYLEDGLITIGGYGGKFFDVDGHPGVRGFVQYFTEEDESGSEELVSLGAAFQHGPRWYLVYFVGSAETITPEVLTRAVATQTALVGAA